MDSSKQHLFVEAGKTGEDYFNAGFDAIAARFGKQVAEANLLAASVNGLTMALDNHASTMRRHTDHVEHGLDRLADIFNEINAKLH